ncbi:MAG: VWA domain-containing protein [Chloroflexi bacterium]|nr:VWA domain-containing protein [Chloroflexota bacterium]
MHNYLKLFLLVGVIAALLAGQSALFADDGKVNSSSGLWQDSDCGIDLVMVLDSSGSISAQDYWVMKEFVVDLVNSFIVGPEEARISIVQFSETVRTEISLSDDAQAIIDAVWAMPKLDQGTNITSGLELAEFEFQNNARPDTPRVTIVLTDGEHNTGPGPIPVADRIRNSETNTTPTIILGVAVGNIKLSEIIGIAGGDENVIQVPDFDGLQLIRSILFDYSCAVVTGVRTSSLPTAEPSISDGQPTATVVPPPQQQASPTPLPTTVAQGPTPTVFADNPLGDTTRIAFASDRDGDSEIFIMNGDGTNVVQLTFNEVTDDKPSWAPGGSQLAFESNLDGDYDIYIMNDDGSNITKLTDNDFDDWGPSWSADGSMIAYHGTGDGDIEIYVMNADGSNSRQLTTNNIATDRSPEWSPDSTLLVYFSDESGGREIYTVNINNGSITRITTDEWYDGHPDWSPDGTLFAFSSTRTSANSEIFTMSVDGSNKRRLTDFVGTDEDPSWSPDGSMIVFENTASGNWDIWIINADGTGLQQLTNDPATDWSADWDVKPCGVDPC